jgi:hypothetical protein
MSQTRRLAAILAADVAGYSRLMGADEEGTLERLKALRRELVDPKIAEHHGRIVKTASDDLTPVSSIARKFLPVGRCRGSASSTAARAPGLCFLRRLLFCRGGDGADGFDLSGASFACIFFRHGHRFYSCMIRTDPV